MGGILIGDKHTERDWGLLWVDFHIPLAQPKTFTFEVPGRDGVIDLTERMGGVKYANRQLTFKFVSKDKSAGAWHALYSEISNYCHGQLKDIILDSDPGFYWTGRVAIESTKEDQLHGILTAVVDVEPYKYELANSTDDWKWSPFNFENGVIRRYKNLEVSGTTTFEIYGAEKSVVPRITCSKAMTLLFEGKTYQLAAGDNFNYDIVLKNGVNQMKFTVSGTGTVTILFKGASL